MKRQAHRPSPHLALFAAFVTLALVGETNSATNKKNSAAQDAEIHFAAPVPLEDALVVGRGPGLRLLYVQHVFSIAGRDFVGFYAVKRGEGLHRIRREITSEYAAFLNDSSRSLQISVPDTSLQQELDLLASGFEQAAIDPEASLGGIAVQALKVEGSLSALKDIHVSSLLGDVLIDEDLINSSATMQEPQNLTVDWKTWVPAYGQTSTGPSAYGGRYVNQNMLWIDTSGFGSNSTYEHDFFLNNYSGSSLGPGTYLSRSKTLSGYPIVAYAASSLPSAYLDTRLGDPETEIAYTIGSASAISIRAYTWYTNYIRTANGDAIRDNAKLVAQLGYRSPSWCYTSYCSYSSQFYSIFPAWTLNVPSGISWERR